MRNSKYMNHLTNLINSRNQEKILEAIGEIKKEKLIDFMPKLKALKTRYRNKRDVCKNIDLALEKLKWGIL